MPEVAPQTQAYLEQLFAESGSGQIPGTWIQPGTLTYDRAAAGEFAPFSVVATATTNTTDIGTNTTDIGTNASDITALQNLLGTDCIHDVASLTYAISGTLTLANTPIAGRRLDVFTARRLRQEGVEYSISGKVITWLMARTNVEVSVRYVY